MIRRSVLLLLALVVSLAACGTDTLSDTSTSSSAGTSSTTTAAPTTSVPSAFPVSVEGDNGNVTIEARPERIVSISPTATEILFGIGAGPQVVAVDTLSNHPVGAPVTDLSAISPNVEAIASFDPDLVVLSFDPDGGLIPALEALGVPAILQGGPPTVEDAYHQWTALGAATGNPEGADALVGQTRGAIEAAFAQLPDGTAGSTYFWELDPTYYSVTSSTFVGDLLAGTGMQNIADDADPDGFGYPQLTAEHIIGANPSLILLADTKCCAQSATTVAERPGWDTMSAVAAGAVVELDDDVASRWGPRIADLVEAVVAGIQDLFEGDA